MGVNKVEVNGETIVDLTNDTVKPETLAEGATAHNASGDPITGALRVYTIDGALSETSTNPVQNQAVANEINSLKESKANQTDLESLEDDVAEYSTLTLGVHSDGKIYLFKNGTPVGTGVEAGTTSDIVGYIDSSNNIVLSGTVAKGTYTVKYEMEDGTLVEIGTLENVDKPKYTNLANPSDSYWQEGYRLSISSGNTSALAKHTTTNFIPCKKGDVLRVKGLNILGSIGGSSDYADYAKIVAYNSSKTKINGLYGGTRTSTSADQDFGLKITKNGDITTYTILVDNLGAQRADTTTAYIRIDGGLMSGYTKNDVIITINQEITD